MSMINPTNELRSTVGSAAAALDRGWFRGCNERRQNAAEKERSLPLRKLNKCRQEYRLYRRLDSMANSPYDHHSSTFPHCHTSGNVSSAFSGLLVPVWILGCSLTMLGSLSKSKIRYQLT